MSIAMDQVKNHILGSSLLTVSGLKSARGVIKSYGPKLAIDFSLILKAYDVISTYESSKQPLFMNTMSSGGFPRESTGTTNDGKELERAMFALHQAVLDEVFHATSVDFPEDASDRTVESAIKPCKDFFDNKPWKTANYYPGNISGPYNDALVHSIQINASMAECWGRPAAFCQKSSIRPTGLYLGPGRVATVTVPQSLVSNGFVIQVGAQNSNFQSKSFHRRFDRIASFYEIKDNETYISSPLGGGLYLRIPHGVNLGLITITVSGGVVQAPIFQKTSAQTTTAGTWEMVRGAPGTWADLETDNFLLQVPKSWMYNYGFSHFNTLADNWKKAMEGASELAGFYPGEQNNYVLYIMPEVDLKFGMHGIGYPQMNDILSTGPNGPTMGFNYPLGKSENWLLTAVEKGQVQYHELG
jgi:hypothetical protein